MNLTLYHLSAKSKSWPNETIAELEAQQDLGYMPCWEYRRFFAYYSYFLYYFRSFHIQQGSVLRVTLKPINLELLGSQNMTRAEGGSNLPDPAVFGMYGGPGRRSPVGSWMVMSHGCVFSCIFLSSRKPCLVWLTLMLTHVEAYIFKDQPRTTCLVGGFGVLNFYPWLGEEAR